MQDVTTSNNKLIWRTPPHWRTIGQISMLGVTEHLTSHCHRPLDNLVLKRSDSERALSAIRRGRARPRLPLH
jgi:hypothetical protein